MKKFVLMMFFLSVLFFYPNAFAQNTSENFVPCLDSPVGWRPNPGRYPEFYDRDNEIHKAVLLHRKHLNCADGSPYEPAMKGQEEQLIELDGSYCNYICRNRKQEQCYDDGSFDTYYDEWCEDTAGNKIVVK